jgi:hypothetical protein
MPRRNKAVSFLLIPIAVFLCFIGWGLSFVGSKKESIRRRSKLSSQKEFGHACATSKSEGYNFL